MGVISVSKSRYLTTFQAISAIKSCAISPGFYGFSSLKKIGQDHQDKEDIAQS